MFNGSVLVATDGSALAERAVDAAAQLAARIGAQLTVVTVEAPYPYRAIGESSAIAGSDYQATVGADASKRLARAAAIAAQAGVTCRTSMQETSDVFRGILTAADQADAGLVVMASHGRSGLSALLLGSETQKLLAHSTLPVLVVR